MPSVLCAADNGGLFGSIPGLKPLECAVETNSLRFELPKIPKPSRTQLKNNSNIVSAFREAVAANPDVVAIDAGARQVTFRELDTLSSRLAWHISAYSAKSRVVPLLTTLSTSAIVGILAILKAGAAYVPIDCAQWSKEHVTRVLELIGGDLLVYSDEFFPQTMYCLQYLVKIPTSQSGLWPWATTDLYSSPAGFDCNIHASSETPGGEDTACVIFTSGTTGKPKGVMLCHESIMNFVSSRKKVLHPTPGLRSLLALTISFDACNSYLFSYLCHGMTTVLADINNLQDRFATCGFVVLTPSILTSLIPPGREGNASFPLLRHMVLGGETVPQTLLAAWHPRGSSWVILNDYGPTESTCTVLTGRFDYDETLRIFNNQLLGAPISGCTVSLRADDGRAITSPGEEGEIVIGGVGLAQGYWRDPERTAERFINWKTGRHYRTGDRGKWFRRASGDLGILFQGRNDRVVKNRGFLVNLEADVDGAVSGSDLACTFNISNLFTVMNNGCMCMLLSPSSVDVSGLKAEMAKRLPAYQVPDRIVAVPKLPLGRTGKVDPKGVLATFQQLHQPPDPHITVSPAHRSLEPWEDRVLSVFSDTLELPRRISPSEKFLEVGGNSLVAVAISGRCKQLSMLVQPRDILLCKCIGDVLDILRQQRANVKSHVAKAEPVQTPRVGPMTRTQRALLYASESSPGASIIQVFFSFSTSDIPRLRQAWETVLDSESIFRTTFDTVKNTQAINDRTFSFSWEEVAVAEGEDPAAVSRRVAVPHDIGTSFRIFSSSKTCQLVWTIHHALVDGYSAGLILQKVGVALTNGGRSSQGPSFLQVIHEIEQCQKPLSGEAAEFWAQQRSEVPNPAGKLELLPIPEQGRPLTDAREMNSTIGGPLGFETEDFVKLARELGVTPVSLFYVAWAILLARHTGSVEVVFGAVLSGRETMVHDIETVVGPLVSTVPIRIHLGKPGSFAELAQQVFSKLHSVNRYQWLYDDQELCSFHTAIASQQNLPAHPFKAELESVYETTTVPITLLIQDDWSFLLNYRTDKYSHSQASQLAESFRGVFQAMVEPGVDLNSCLGGVMTDGAKLQLLRFGNVFSKTTFADTINQTMLDVFDRTVRGYGELTAVEKGSTAITYRELDWASTKLARRIAQSVALGDVVALHATRCINWVIGILGIIKAGAAYCPLDESLPVEVRCDLFSRSGATLFVAPSRHDLLFAPSLAQTCVAIDDVLKGPESPDVPAFLRDPHALAYVCFTSGSTGKPKGVAVEHASVVAMQGNLDARMQAGPGRRVMQFLAAGFDGSMLEVFSAILNGATLVLRADEQDALAALRYVDIAILTPSAVEGLEPADFPNMKYLYFGGEPLSRTTVERWAHGRQLFNYYGPTEVTMGSVLKKCKSGSQITIGKPHPSIRAYILDDSQQLVPRGVVGEIVLAGVQVSRGYLGMPEETATNFLPDTISGRLHERMYRTGDLGYWTEDGDIVCLGRKDRQVKLRGFRVGLGSVEQAICSALGVHAAAVVVDRGLLLAWVTPSGVDIDVVLKEIESKLPSHARPQRVSAVDSFPLTANGKIDHKALLRSTNSRSVRQSVSRNAVDLTQTEEKIAKVWQNLLDLNDAQPVLPSDNFLSLGGHSMKQLALAARLSSIFGFRVPVQVVLKCEALSELAGAVDLLSKNQVRQSQTGARKLGPIDLSPSEYEWWLKYQVASPVAAACFNVVFSCSLAEPIRCSLLANAWSSVISRHRVLSSRFLTDCTGVPFRSISPAPPQAQVVDTIDLVKFAGRSFDLAAEDLIRVQISPSRILVVISHILCDLTALRVLLNEVSAEYSRMGGLPSPDPPKFLAYTETTSWFDRPSQEDLDFWAHYLKGSPAPIPDSVPTDYSGVSQTISFPPNLFRKMTEFGGRNSMTIYQTLLLGSAITLQALSKTSDIVLGTPYINRTNELEANTVGLFLQPMPFRMNLSDTPLNSRIYNDVGVSSLVDRTKSSFQGMLGHIIQWQKLLAHIGLDFRHGTDPYPLFDTVVSLHDYRTIQPISLDIDGAGPAEFPCTKGAKFKIMFEYTVTQEGDVSLRIEYRRPRMSHEAVATVYRGLLACFKGLSDGSSTTTLRDAILDATGGPLIGL